jgi:tRNA G18 (ribose-2'-O)-methylase SpoU
VVLRQSLHRSVDRHEFADLPRLPLVPCASLVQNLANLGGLCRTAEAFRLEALVLADMAIAQTSAFRKIAVSTHHWQPLIGCTPTALPDWLHQQQQVGYTIIGLHADPQAVALPTFQFPRCSVLLLGQELTGIPAALLSQCDVTVAIPQAGMVESLNVQTAAAIAIYEYVRQQSFDF